MAGPPRFHAFDLIVRGGRIVDPSRGTDFVGDLLISGGVVRQAGPGRVVTPPGSCVVIDAAGLIVCPGFIDVHCHLRQPGFEDSETIATGTHAAARGGFSSVCCMANTSPPLDTPATVEYVKALASIEGLVRVFPVCCVTLGRAGKQLADLGELSASGAIAFSDDGSPVADASIMRSALIFSRDSGMPIIDHCEDLSLSRGGVMNAGALAGRLRLDGIPAAAEERMVARDIELAMETGGWLHIAHVSTAGSLELIRRAREQGAHVTAEVTPHHLTMTEEMVSGYDTSAKVNPPLRTAADVEALIGGVRDGTIEVVATDHAPHTDEDKASPFNQAPFGISGLETALGSLMDLVRGGKLDLATLVSRLTDGPARFLRRDDMGTLRPGVPADLTAFDPEMEWEVRRDTLVSKGKNTPLIGRRLKGKVMLTLVGGALAYKDEAISVVACSGAEVNSG